MDAVTDDPLAEDREDVAEVVLTRASGPWKEPEATSEARRDKDARKISAECNDGVRKATCKERGEGEKKVKLDGSKTRQE